MRDERAAAPVVGKTLEAAIVVLYLGILTTALYAGAVPGYRTVAGDAVADRTVATASQRVQQAIPPNGTAVEVTARVDLPTTIRGRMYVVRADGRRLVLNHPHPDVRATARLALPPSVVNVSGEWSSDESARVEVRSTGGGLAVRLERGTPGDQRSQDGEGQP